jgi:hypothetical protein
MSTRRRTIRLVRYISPFAIPAWMPRERAEGFLEDDDRRWGWMQDIEAATGEPIISEYQRRVGPPRIEVHDG